jgi:hypothetical protein
VASASTASTTYVDLPTVGASVPTLTVALPTGTTQMEVSVSAGLFSSTGSTICWMSFTITGVTPVADNSSAALDARGLALLGGNGINNLQQVTRTYIITGLPAGSSPVLTAQYKTVGSGSCTWSNRTITAIPLPGSVVTSEG